MKYAVLSDIHSNWEALSSAEKEIKKYDVDYIVCLGDAVGYNADPNRCLEEITGLADFMVRGNHDKAVAGLMSIDYFNSMAREAVQWTRTHISLKNLAILKKLPAGPLLVNDRYLICHGSPMDEDRYIITYTDINEIFFYINRYFKDTGICFFGHTHVPLVFEENSGLLDLKPEIQLDPSKRYLINPGSVGQPRDGSSKASLGVFDNEKYVYRYVRFDYPVDITQRKVIEAGLPRALAVRLYSGN